MSNSGEFEFPQSAIIASHHLPVAGLGSARLSYLVSAEHSDRTVVVMSVGHASALPVVRIQSRCLFGEVYRSSECDCGEQLWMSLAEMQSAGSGLLIHLDQEGRGLGIRRKALAYQHAERTGGDAFDAYGHLGLEHDARRYVDAIHLLQLVGVRRCVLLTNNPNKVRALEEAGIEVDRRSLWVPTARAKDRFVEAKQREGHLA